MRVGTFDRRDLGPRRPSWLHQEERARTQWNANNTSLTALVARAEVAFEHPHDRRSVVALRDEHESGRRVFSDLLGAGDASGSDPDNPAASALEARLTAQLLLISQEMIADAAQLAEGSRDDIASTQRGVGLLLGGFLVAATATIATGLLLFTRRVLDPISTLEEGTRLIGAGDWGSMPGTDNSNRYSLPTP